MVPEQDEINAAKATPLCEAIFEHLLARRGAAGIAAHLRKNLQSPASNATGLRSNDRILVDVQVNRDGRTWKYVWRTHFSPRAREETEVAPWEVLDPHFSVSEPANLYMAAKDAADLWSVATDEFLKLLGRDYNIFGRIADPTAPYRQLDNDQIDRLNVSIGTNEGDIQGVMVFSLRVSERKGRNAGRRPDESARVKATLERRYPNLLPESNEVARAVLEEEGVRTSPSTIQRVMRGLRKERDQSK